MELLIPDLEALPKAATEVIRLLGQHRHLLFYGDMGMGKTTFITELLRQLGVNETEGSPTYSLINSYDTTSGKVYHMDLYRLKTANEAYDIGIEEILDSGDYCLIEWPQLIENWVDEKALTLKFELLADETRKITIFGLPDNK